MESFLEKFTKFRIWLTNKIWRGETPDKILAKRFELFVIVCISFIGLSQLLSAMGLPLPNLEMIIPVLIVMGAFSIYTGVSEKWSNVDKYFGILVLPIIFITDVVFWGFYRIYLFKWPAFIGCWLLAKRKDLSFFDGFSDLAFEATILAAVGIIFFDYFTATGWWLARGGALTLGGLIGIYIAQIPFTFYHFSSLIFVPPLVGLGKAMSKVKVKVPTAVRAGEKEGERR